MALDNANFIAELSITDPPGSDPLSQGDDQIRTCKRSVFNSFAFIDKAVTITADQMNLMAIKNEANVFTASQTLENADLFLNQITDQVRQIIWRVNGNARWSLRMEASAANTNFGLRRSDAAGVEIDFPFSIDHTTGVVDFAQVPTIKGDPIWTAGEIKMLVTGAALPSNNWFSCNGTNGTVDLRNRFFAMSDSFVGNRAPFVDLQTDVGPATGNTALTEAQMPVHTHRIWSGGSATGITDVTFATADTVTGANRGNTAKIYRDTTASGAQIIEAAGSGNTHGHSIPELEVDIPGSDAFQIMPYSYHFQTIQYVP